MALFDNIEDIVDMIAPIFGRLEEGEDPARKAIEDPSSPEAAMLGSLVLGSKGRKAVEGVVSDPVGKAKKLKRIGMRDIPTTATELPPEIPDEIKKLAGIEPKAKPSMRASAPRGTFEKLVSEPEVRKSVSEMRGPVNEKGFASKMDEFTDAQKFQKVGKEVAEEGAKSGGKKALSVAKTVAKFPFKHPIFTLAGIVALNSIFGDKKKATTKPPQTKLKETTKPKKAGVDPVMQQFDEFRKQIDEELRNLER